MRPTLIAVLLALALIPATPAAHCEGFSTSSPEVDTGETAAGRHYADLDPNQIDGFALWIYEESNGIDGLQRDDEYHSDVCHGSIQADTLTW